MSKQHVSCAACVEWLAALWQFARPHTIIGTSLSVLGLAVLAGTAALRAGSDLADLPGWPLGLVIVETLGVSLIANLYIVGLNQLEDIEIDRINKPHLPLAAGTFSVAIGRWIVILSGGGSLLFAWFLGPILFSTVGASMLIGTGYSVPPLRLKRFPFWAAVCIFGVRGLIVNLGFFLHFQHFLGMTEGISSDVWLLTGFVVLFATAIAIVKDIPDIEGDRRFHIRTLTLRLGTEAVFNLARGMITISYLLMLWGGFAGWTEGSRVLLSASHGGLLIVFWWVSIRVNLHSQREITQFYQFIWKLFFLEYLVFPLACLANA